MNCDVNIVLDCDLNIVLNCDLNDYLMDYDYPHHSFLTNHLHLNTVHIIRGVIV